MLLSLIYPTIYKPVGITLLGKILFVNVIPISGSCQSIVYRSVP